MRSSRRKCACHVYSVVRSDASEDDGEDGGSGGDDGGSDGEDGGSGGDDGGSEGDDGGSDHNDGEEADAEDDVEDDESPMAQHQLSVGNMSCLVDSELPPPPLSPARKKSAHRKRERESRRKSGKSSPKFRCLEKAVKAAIVKLEKHDRILSEIRDAIAYIKWSTQEDCPLSQAWNSRHGSPPAVPQRLKAMLSSMMASESALLQKKANRADVALQKVKSCLLIELTAAAVTAPNGTPIIVTATNLVNRLSGVLRKISALKQRFPM